MKLSILRRGRCRGQGYGKPKDQVPYSLVLGCMGIVMFTKARDAIRQGSMQAIQGPYYCIYLGPFSTWEGVGNNLVFFEPCQ